jgi:AraC-like DNA-binding protein
MVARARITRHASALGRWEMAESEPMAPLRPYVHRYAGWFEHMAAPLVRRELPTEIAPLIIGFNAPVRLYDLDDPGASRDLTSFVTGAYDVAQLVGSAGPSGGVQVDFTLMGMRRLLGRPLDELKNRAVAIEDVLGPRGREMPEQLQELDTWDARFELLDTVLAPRVLSSHRIASGVLCTWDRLTVTRGQTRIQAIVDDVGWSQKHLIARFRKEIGLSPKVFARLLRFSRAVRIIKLGRAARLADLALRCGYYDQAHLVRDVRQFAGITPGELVASLLPDGGGFVDERTEHTPNSRLPTPGANPGDRL